MLRSLRALSLRHFTEDRRKLRELILYISREARSHPDYGSTHLNKLLFFADFLAYAKFGEPITGAEYIREKHGPVPRPVRMGARSPVRELIKAGDLRLQSTALPRNMTRVTPVALREPDLSVFSAEELELVKSIIDTFPGWTAGRISKYTHELPQWHSVPLDEVIPYELVFVSENQQFTDAEIEHGLELARRHGWPVSKQGR